METDTAPETLLTPAHAAQLAHRSERTVWRWIKTGALAAVRVGTRVYIPREALAEVLRPRPR